MFVCGLSSHSRIFHSYGDVTITGEGLQILTYARHLWPLSSEGSLACHTYCDTGHPFIMVISEDLWHSHLLPSVYQWSCHYLFLRLRSVRTPKLANVLTHCATAAVKKHCNYVHRCTFFGLDLERTINLLALFSHSSLFVKHFFNKIPQNFLKRSFIWYCGIILVRGLSKFL